MKRVSKFKLAVLPFGMGLTASLYLHVPALGVLPMFDLFSYAVSLLVIMTQWRKMGKYMRRTIIFGIAWSFAALISNTLNFVDLKYTLKCFVVSCSSWALASTAFLFLKDDARQFMWYLVGAGLGGWVSLYHFQNGAYLATILKTGLSAKEALIEKQRFPYIARGLFLGCTLPFFLMWKKLPTLLAIGACVFAGFYLLIHGGSRSYFGIFLASAAAGFGTVYAKKILQMVVKSRISLIVFSLVAVTLIFAVYKIMAKSGDLGESELAKYENEFSEGSQSGLGSRTGYDYAVQAVLRHPMGIGGQLRCHSVIMNTLACDGPIGFLFWVYFYLQVLWFVCNRMPYMGRWTTFFMVNLVSACWDCLGSPFGSRHEYFVLMAFIALCRDQSLYGCDILFTYSPRQLAKLMRPSPRQRMMPYPQRPMVPMR